MKLPKTVTQTFYITAKPNGVTVLNWRVSDNDQDGYVCIAERAVVFDVPQEDPVNKIIASLRKAQSSIRAGAEAESLKLEEKIQSLLALPNPDSVVDSDGDLPIFNWKEHRESSND